MIVRQMVTGPWDVCTYLVGCEETGRAMVIDPGGEPEAILAQARTDGLAIELIVNTHGHADHTAANAAIQAATGAAILIHRLDGQGAPGAGTLVDGGERLHLGRLSVEILHTPGHSPGSICLLAEGQLFTGDTLFVKDSGRTDLPGGDRATLGASLRRLMRDLPEETMVWPGHDYGPMPSSTLGWEKRNNLNAREYGYWTADETT